MTVRPTRRQYLTAIGAASVVGVAGCSGGGTDDEPADDDDEGDETESESTDDGSTEGDDSSGFLQSDAEETGQQSSDQVTNRLEVVSSVGEDISDRTIATVRSTVKKAPGAGDIDLAATTLQFVHSSGATDLTFGSYSADEPTGDGTTFDVTDVQDADGSIGDDGVVLNDPADRAQFVLDVSAIVSSDGGLTEGDTATIRMNTESGGSTELRLVVPETLSGAAVVNL